MLSPSVVAHAGRQLDVTPAASEAFELIGRNNPAAGDRESQLRFCIRETASISAWPLPLPEIADNGVLL